MKRLAVPFVTTIASACAAPEAERQVQPSVSVVEPPSPTLPPAGGGSAARLAVTPPEGMYGPGVRLFATVAPDDQGNCRLHFSVECPGAVCNPPAPRTVSCHGPEWRIEAAFSSAYPAGAVLWKKIDRRPDGTCQASYSVDCLTPPGGRCNPPAPRAVDCEPSQ